MYNILTIALVIYGLQATGEVNQDIIYTSQDLHLDPNQNEKKGWRWGYITFIYPSEIMLVIDGTWYGKRYRHDLMAVGEPKTDLHLCQLLTIRPPDLDALSGLLWNRMVLQESSWWSKRGTWRRPEKRNPHSPSASFFRLPFSQSACTHHHRKSPS